VNDLSPGDRLAVGADELAALLSVSVRTIRELDRRHELPVPVRVGARVLWSVDEIRCWLAAGAPGRAVWQDTGETARDADGKSRDVWELVASARRLQVRKAARGAVL
jgi:predicted DNA-binding transcriptional regulator AlpA